MSSRREPLHAHLRSPSVAQRRNEKSWTDLLVVGWTAALVYDTPEGAASTTQLLAYANSQLLEFRHYDHVLALLLAQVYDAVSRGTGFLAGLCKCGAAGVWRAPIVASSKRIIA